MTSTAANTQWLVPAPSHWGIDRLKWSTATLINGVWGDEPNGEDDIVCVRVADFDRDAFRVAETPPTLRAVASHERQGRELQKGDLLLEKSGGGDQQLVGCVVLFDHDFDAVCSNFVARLVLRSGMYPRYWCYVHAAIYAARLNMSAIKQTTGIQNLDAKEYLNLPGPYPPVAEQRAIADYLDRETGRLDALIAAKGRLLGLLAEKRQALITRAVTRGLDPNVPLRDSGIPWLGPIPAHWETVALRFLVDVMSGATPETGKSEYWDGEIPWVSPKDMKRDEITDSEDYVTEVALSDSALRLVPADAVLVVVRGMILAHSFPVALTMCEVTINQDMKALLCRPVILPQYLRDFLRGVVRHVVSLVDASAHGTRKLETEILGRLQVCVPPINEQTEISEQVAEYTSELDRLFALTAETIALLKERRSALIAAAVTGQIRIPSEAVA